MVPLLLAVAGGIICVVLFFILPKREADPPGSAKAGIWNLSFRSGPAFGLVIFTMASLFFLSMPTIDVGIRTSRKAQTVNEMMRITTAFQHYVVEYEGAPPGNDPAGFIRNLVSDNRRGILFLDLRPEEQDAQGRPIDHWGTPLSIEVLDARHLTISSAGPDRTWLTPDDLHGGIPPEPDTVKR